MTAQSRTIARSFINRGRQHLQGLGFFIKASRMVGLVGLLAVSNSRQGPCDLPPPVNSAEAFIQSLNLGALPSDKMDHILRLIQDTPFAVHLAELHTYRTNLMAKSGLRLPPTIFARPSDLGLSSEIPKDLEEHPSLLEDRISKAQPAALGFLEKNHADLLSQLSNEEKNQLARNAVQWALFLETRNKTGYTLTISPKTGAPPFCLIIFKQTIYPSAISHELWHTSSFRPYTGTGIFIEESGAHAFALLKTIDEILSNLEPSPETAKAVKRFMITRETDLMNRSYFPKFFNPHQNHILPGLVIAEFGPEFALRRDDQNTSYIFETIARGSEIIAQRIQRWRIDRGNETDTYYQVDVNVCIEEDKKINPDNSTEVFYALLYTIEDEQESFDPVTRNMALRLLQTYYRRVQNSVSHLEPRQVDVCTQTLPPLRTLIPAPAEVNSPAFIARHGMEHE